MQASLHVIKKIVGAAVGGGGGGVHYMAWRRALASPLSAWVTCLHTPLRPPAARGAARARERAFRAGLTHGGIAPAPDNYRPQRHEREIHDRFVRLG